jgi:hypothetical protein
MTAVPHAPCSISPIEYQTERPPFGRIEEIAAESQAVPNTLIQHDFQDAFIK